MSATTALALPALPEAHTTPAPLELVDVVSILKGRVVLDGVNLALTPGRLTVLIGPSGAGKTVCVKHLVGLMTPARGQALSEGRDLAFIDYRARREMRHELSLMQQGSTLFTCGLFGNLDVYENVAYPLRRRESWDEDELDDRVWTLLDRVGLAGHAYARPHMLSGGMARRIALARALVSRSPVTIIDDLDSGVDGVRLTALADLVHEHQRETGCAMLVTTHDEGLARDLGDELAVLHRGRIDQLGPPAEILDQPGFAAQFMSGDTACQLTMDDDHELEVAGRADNPEHDPWCIEGDTILSTIVGLGIVIVLAAAWLALAAWH